MKTSLPLLVLSFFMSLPFLSFAQPHGCMQAKQSIQLSPLTPEEKAFIQASNERSDTIDILNYEINMEVQYSPNIIIANCVVTFSPKMDNVSYLALDLLDLDVDSVHWNGAPINFDFDGLLLEIFFPNPLNSTDMENVRVFYQGEPTVDPTGFGGFDYNGNYAYNLGIGLGSNPYNFGRSWFPCFDNFVERSTYDFNVISPSSRKAYCVGTFIGETSLANNKTLRQYSLSKEIPTYLASVAVSDYTEYNEVHMGAYGPVDIQLVGRTEDINDMIATFANLVDAVDALEFWYGPYVWDRVGFVHTVVGAMEHPGNIAYPESVGVGGNDDGHKRLMAHELAHCWFGDIVTLSGPENMWFKEGNAEYGAHLFTEYLDGREDFIIQVKENFLGNVLKIAHLEDDGYQQLSGIPYEHTYGTHTYRKGASMIHNLRAYLGDSLFRVGQQQVLNTFAFSSLNAEQYRDELISATGETDKLTSYFDDWIFAPGYASYEIDSFFTEPAGSEYEVTVHIQQKLRAAPHLHTNTPIEVSFMDNDWNLYTEEIMVSDEFTTVQVNVPFEPEISFLNGGGNLNIAKLQQDMVIKAPVNRFFGLPEFQIQVFQVVDSAYFRVEHYWVAADEIGNNPDNAQISENHFWRVDGIWPEVFNVRGTVNYKSTTEYNGELFPYLDEDLTSTTENDVILVYRPYPGYPWTEYDDYTINQGTSPNDGTGTMFINGLKKGDYAFANGTLDVVNTQNIFKEEDIEIIPNPASDYLSLESDLLENKNLNYQLLDIQGKLIQSDQLDGTINISSLSNGTYIIQLVDEKGNNLGAQQFEKIK